MEFLSETGQVVAQFLIILSIMIPIIWRGWKAVKAFVSEAIQKFIEEQLEGFIEDHKHIKDSFQRFVDKDFKEFSGRVQNVEKSIKDLSESFKDHATQVDARLHPLEKDLETRTDGA
jgi:uncharacterized protein YoxC